MKTIMSYTEPLIYEHVIARNNQARVMRVLQTVHNEAIDACIEAIEKLQRPIYTVEYRGTLGHAIEAIEELKEK